MPHNHPFRRLVRALLLLLLHVFLLGPAIAAESIKIAVAKTPLSLPLYVAERQGFFVAEGLSVQLTEVIGGHRAFQLMADGKVDLATSSDAVVMFNSFQRNDFAIIATFVTSNDDAKIVVGPNAEISRPQQLAGKRIGTVAGTSAHYFLDTLMLSYGVDPKAARISNLQPEVMAEAIQRGAVDAVAIWEPYSFEILHAVPGSKLLPKSGVYVTTFNLIASKHLFKEHDGALVKLLRALDRAQYFIADKPTQAQTILRNQLGLDPSFIDWVWPRYHYRLSLEQGLIKTLESEARWARRENQVKGKHGPYYLDFIHSGPLRKVRADAVNIVE